MSTPVERGTVLAIRFVAHVAALDEAARSRIAAAVARDDAYEAAARQVRATLADARVPNGETLFPALDAVVDAVVPAGPVAAMVKQVTRALVVHALPGQRRAFDLLYAPFEDDVAFETLLLA